MPAQASIQWLWQRLEGWAAQNAPGLTRELNPPAAPAVIAQAEREIGASIPLDLRESLLIHDGESGDGRIYPGGGFIGAERIGATWRQFKANRARHGEVACERAQGPARGVAWAASHIPFLMSDSYELGWVLDLAPAPGGAVAQVVYFDIEAGMIQVQASSYAAFLSNFVAELESGRVEIEDRYRHPVVSEAEERNEAVLQAAHTELLKQQPAAAELKRTRPGQVINIVGTLGVQQSNAGVWMFHVYGGMLWVRARFDRSLEEQMADIAATREARFRIQGQVVPRSAYLGDKDVVVDVTSWQRLP